MNNLKRIALKTFQSKMTMAMLLVHRLQDPDCPLLYILELTENSLII